MAPPGALGESPLRILYQCNGFLPSLIGGVEILSHHLVRELCRRGHDVLVVTERRETDLPGRQRFDGIDIVRLGFDAAMARRSLAAMRATSATVGDIVNAFRPDVLHLNDTGLGSLFFLHGGATGRVPRVLTFHSPIRAPNQLGLQRRLALDVDRIVAVSQAIGAAVAAAMPDLQGKLSVIRNALPMPGLPPTALPFAPPMLLCVGRLVSDKGFDLAVRAFALLRGRGSAARLTIAGNGDEKIDLETLARGLDVADHVTFLDWVMPDRVPELLNRATLVLMPSRWAEPFGLVALQAAQMGRPVIAAAVGGLPEIVDHGMTGLLVESGDESALADAVRTLLADEAAARRYGATARERARDAFDFAALVDAYEQVYAEASASCAGPSGGPGRVGR